MEESQAVVCAGMDLLIDCLVVVAKPALRASVRKQIFGILVA